MLSAVALRVAVRETVTRRISVVAFTQYAALLCAAALRWQNTRSVLPAQRNNAQRMCERPFRISI